MGEAESALGEVERQRAKLAGQLRLPAWYVLLYAVGAAVLLAAPLLYTTGFGVVGAIGQAFGIAVLCSPAFLVPRLIGVRLPARTSAAYPSVARTVLLQVGALMVGTGGVLVLNLNGLGAAALAVAVLGGIAAGFAIRNVYRGIGRDIAAGQVRL
ncbi:hypothetical protein LZ318_15980 [Saccharopolyspora indica]|uniref:hypothetical protein n=1 Tax=Saccharopolyspora indica TaxID=1229659 RepID=UPI0022EAA813|nr:hypothetical protein [Saccharopolyspora indica]MDA3645919.1 hypothetical protein [Saccharopolyspora indica]